MDQTVVYSLRLVQTGDEALLLEIYSSTRADELALVPWDAAQKGAFLRMQLSAQQTHYQAYFPRATHELILVDGQAVGRLYVDRRADEIRILDITLLPEARGRGIGTHILLDLMKEAEHRQRAGHSQRAEHIQQACSIYVESFNRSLGLFQRLGFKKTEENGASWLMVWRAGL